MEELVVLVTDEDKPIGTMPKLAAHNSKTPLHRGFSCYVFNQKGEFLLTQRALSKKVWPGIWTNSCCGHPAPNEKTEDAVLRRLQYMNWDSRHSNSKLFYQNFVIAWN